MKKNKKIIINIGIPASGKSTWSIDFVSKNDGWVRVCRDDFRFMLKNAPVCEPKIEDLITDLVDTTISKSLAKNLNVIVDATNLKVSYIQRFIDKFKYSADIDYRVFDISLDKAIERDKNREKKVGEEVIKKMYQQYKVLLDTFDFQPITKKERPFVVPTIEPHKETVVLFDIDGTLAHMKNRGPYDWHKVDNDLLNQTVAEHVEFHKSKGRKIIMLSGRDGSCRSLTEEWLQFYGIHFDELLMRTEGDMRKDTIIKRELYNEHIKDKFNVHCVYDDRLQVLEMWSDEKVFTFNVNQGMLEF